MARWYVKDLSQFTKVSVRTLHYYDSIGLLKPSVRLPNGYRKYNESDLFRLQQILVLKFFGFELSQIATLLQKSVDFTIPFSLKSRLLKEKAEALLDASKTLDNILSDCHPHIEPPWEKLLQLMEVYQMTRDFDKSWIGKALSEEEFKKFSEILPLSQKNNKREDEEEPLKKRLALLLKKVEDNLNIDPSSDFGVALGKGFIDLLNDLYEPNYSAAHSNIKKNGSSFNSNNSNYIDRRAFTWLEEAMNAYYREMIYNLLKKAETDPSEKLEKEWDQLLSSMYGSDQTRKDDLYQTPLTDNKVSQKARDWLKKIVYQARQDNPKDTA